MRKRTRTLRFDCLEPRTPLAGNITAHVIDGHLVIRGDNGASQIRVDTQLLGPGQVRVVVGVDQTVNREGDSKILRGWFGDVRVLLAGGDDRLVLQGLAVRGNVRIDGGGGDDTVLLDRCEVRQNVRIDGGDGHDALHLVQSQTGGATRLDAGNAHDVIALSRSSFRGSVQVSGGFGNDTVLLDSDFQGRLTLDPGPGDDRVYRGAVAASFDFRSGARGWQAGFSDYPAGEEEFYELRSGIRQLPDELAADGTGFFLSGNNHSDDLFMYLKRRMTAAEGIVAGQTYQVRLRIVLASKEPSDCFGIGGSPGNSVFLKAGASTIEPRSVVQNGAVRLNVDKGDQAFGGSAASVVSNIANGIPCDAANHADPRYVSLARGHVHEFLATANASGELWLIVGTDSGFEGTTTLYYQRIDVELIPIAPSALPEPRAKTTNERPASSQSAAPVPGGNPPAPQWVTPPSEHFVKPQPDDTQGSTEEVTHLTVAEFLENLLSSK